MPTLKKQEILKGKKNFDRLFVRGIRSDAGPLTAIRLEVEKNSEPLKAAFLVPVKSFSRAVERNRLRRQMREAYRLNKDLLADALKHRQTTLHLLFIYHSKSAEPFSAIQQSMVLILQRLLRHYA
jgi:ribonuclease P protein component